MKLRSTSRKQLHVYDHLLFWTTIASFFKQISSKAANEAFGLLLLAMKEDQECVLIADIAARLGLKEFGGKTFKHCEVDSLGATSLSKSSMFQVIEKIEDMFLKLFEE